MTAEIAIINRSAVALAADSAQTIRLPGQLKVYNSANKLLMLSSRAPVGVMAYGDANYMGIPWETVFKVFRQTVGEQRRERLVDYANEFFAFLGRTWAWPPLAEQDKLKATLVTTALEDVKTRLKSRLERRLRTEAFLSRSQISRAASAAVAQELADWSDAPYFDGFDHTGYATAIRSESTLLNALIDRVFEDLPLAKLTRQKLARIAAHSLVRYRERPWTTGIVVAGFGVEDIYPSLEAFHVDGVIDGKLRYVRDSALSIRISSDDPAALIPFAQSNVVASFMEGVDPSYSRTRDAYLADVLGRLSPLVNRLVPTSSRGRVRSEVDRFVEVLLAEIREHLSSYREATYVQPVAQTIAGMPKEEMAAMAEALVNLASFRQRFTMEDETVGGPIDVVVITKGDGFVWIKRKHYFDPQLNPRFLARYHLAAEGTGL